MATNRIIKEYKSLLSSHDFKEIVNVKFIKDNVYQWLVIFDIAKYEIYDKLKDDFK